MAISVIENASFGNSGIVTANGIKFPATQVASADANTLDDYEEGTWTPVVAGASTAGTYTPSNVRAYYTKIGNQVTLYGGFGFSAASGGTGYCVISGIPFSYKASSAAIGNVFLVNLNLVSSTPAGLCISNTTGSSATTLYIAETIDNAGTNDAPISGVSTSTLIYFTLTYTTS